MNTVKRGAAMILLSCGLFIQASGQSHGSDGIQFGKTWVWIGMPEAQALTTLKGICQVRQSGLGTYGVLPQNPDCFGFVIFKNSKLVYANRAATLAGENAVTAMLTNIVQFTDTYHTESCTLATSLGKGHQEFHAFVHCGQHTIHIIDSPTEKSVSEELGEIPED